MNNCRCSEATLRQRFEDKVCPEPNTGCWLWTGAVTAFKRGGGYGRIGRQGRDDWAHRVSWELYRGPIPAGAVLCHKCDTPACVNPDHLFLGTQRDNVQDMIAKGRKVSVGQKGEAHPHAKITAEAVREIRRAGTRRYRRGELADLAKRYGVTESTIWRARNGFGWKEV